MAQGLCGPEGARCAQWRPGGDAQAVAARRRFTKMGFGGNAEPSYIVPTAIATNDSRPDSRTRKDGVNDLDFYIGNEVGLAGKGWRARAAP